jgi:glycosyltransferase involved in cell wall biosynthesis
VRIAQVAPPLESVPPLRYGGTERVIWTLTEELVRRGHDVTLFASGDSTTSARLVPVLDRALWHQKPVPPYAEFGPFWSLTLGRMLRELHSFDIIHSHLDYTSFATARAAPRPMLTTLHGRLDTPELEAVYQEYTDIPLVSISDAQRAPAPHANWQATIHHGILADEFTFRPEPGRYLAFLGRISPDKGVDLAIKIAIEAGWPIRIAARMPLPYKDNPEARRDWAYYENEVQPLLEGPEVELIGQVGGKQKDDFLGNAAALLFPIRWPEPFGLVMVEALACGTPVLGLRAGSVAEVVRDGATGFVRDTSEELAEALSHLSEIDRYVCRREAETRFSAGCMVDRYEGVYKRLALAGPGRTP